MMKAAVLSASGCISFQPLAGRTVAKSGTVAHPKSIWLALGEGDPEPRARSIVLNRIECPSIESLAFRGTQRSKFHFHSSHILSFIYRACSFTL
jgi:hypothetical protein